MKCAKARIARMDYAFQMRKMPNKEGDFNLSQELPLEVHLHLPHLQELPLEVHLPHLLEQRSLILLPELQQL